MISVTADEAVRALERMIVPGSTHQACSLNLDTWLKAVADPAIHRIMAGFSMILPDGRPLKWASRLLGCPLPEYVSAADLVQRLAELSARKSYRIFLLGSKAGVTSRVSESLERQYPGVRIVGTYASVEGNPNQMDRARILKRIHATQPDILLVDSGDPKQEEWIWLHRNRLGVPLAMGVAGSFNILAGDVRPVPRWIQHCGLQWAMRLAHEPIRFGLRSSRNLYGLLSQLPLAFLAARCQRTFLYQSRVATAVANRVQHFHIYGRLGSESAAALQDAVTASIVNGQVMVVHLRSVRQVTPGGFGILLEMRRQLLQAGLSLSLAGLTLKTRFLMRAWRLQQLFDEWQPAISRSRPSATVTQMPVRIILGGEPRVLSTQAQVRG
jgi:N-acetylglucosaminyldiphosphoundecaprenol N-acetyl-beta-D-mannosaminyltransferase